jgi:hypothetical protein
MSVDSSSRYRSASAGVSVGSGKTVTIPPVTLPQVSWLLTVVACLIAALLLLINGYVGYFGVLLAVAASAAVNLR